MRKIKKMFIALLAALLLFGVNTVALAQSPAAIQVMLNGEYLSFSDALPKNQEGRVMLPFRHLLEALNATVSFNAANQSVTASLDDTTISFTIGQNTLHIAEHGAVRTVEMNVTPYIDAATGRTYVPVRFIAEAYDVSVSWDAQKNTVLIFDTKSFAAGVDEVFSIVNMCLQEDQNLLSKPFKITGTLMAQPNTSGSDAYAITIIANARMLSELHVPLGTAATNLSAPQKTALENAMKNWQTNKPQASLENEDRVVYIRSELFANTSLPSSTGAIIDENTWIKMDGYSLKALLDEAKYTLTCSQILQSETKTVGTFFATLLDSPLTTVDTYTFLLTAVDVFEGAFGDDAFEVVNGQPFNLYSLSTTPQSFAQKITSLQEHSSISPDAMNLLIESMQLNRFIADPVVFQETDGALASYLSGNSFRYYFDLLHLLFS